MNHLPPLSSLFMPVNGEEAWALQCFSYLWGHLSHELDPISISLKSKIWHSERKWCANITYNTPSSLLTNSVSGMNKCACVHAYTCTCVFLATMSLNITVHTAMKWLKKWGTVCMITLNMAGPQMEGSIFDFAEETEYWKEVENEPVKCHNPLDLKGACDSKQCEIYPPRTAVATEMQLWQGLVC